MTLMTHNHVDESYLKIVVLQSFSDVNFFEFNNLMNSCMGTIQKARSLGWGRGGDSVFSFVCYCKWFSKDFSLFPEFSNTTIVFTALIKAEELCNLFIVNASKMFDKFHLCW